MGFFSNLKASAVQAITGKVVGRRVDDALGKIDTAAINEMGTELAPPSLNGSFMETG